MTELIECRVDLDSPSRRDCLSSTQEANEFSHAKVQIASITLLSHFAIDRRLDCQTSGVSKNTGAHDLRTQGCVLVKRLGQAPLRFVSGFVFIHLPVPTADVVGTYVASDVIQGILFGDVLCFFADDDGQLSFVVQACLAELWNGNR